MVSLQFIHHLLFLRTPSTLRANQKGYCRSGRCCCCCCGVDLLQGTPHRKRTVFVGAFAACQELVQLIPHARLVEITPKARDKAAYTSDFKAALAAFLKDVLDGKAR